MNREQKQTANRKRYIYEKYVNIFINYIKNKKWEYCWNLVAMMKKNFAKILAKFEFCKRIFLQKN
jgi:hypothetical protein